MQGSRMVHVGLGAIMLGAAVVTAHHGVRSASAAGGGCDGYYVVSPAAGQPKRVLVVCDDGAIFRYFIAATPPCFEAALPDGYWLRSLNGQTGCPL